MRFGRGYATWTSGPGAWEEGGRHSHGGRHRHGGPHGRRRMFDGGELKLVLLALIAEKPRHGYDLIREIEARSGGAYAPSPGVIYPTLTMLGEMGLIEEQATEGAKKVYAPTEEGARHLEERANEVAEFFERLSAAASQQERTEGGPVRRAMANLKMALKQRLMQAEEDETLHEVAAILDEAARKIERL